MTEDEMAGWHHRLNEHEFEQTPGDSGGQGSLVCCNPWDRKESVTTERLNKDKIVCIPGIHFPASIGLFYLPKSQ